jgi:tetraacyldisaccharide 4'-kinase
LRRLAYSHGWKSSFSVDVPVWVVGNITAGGSGKTPMVIWLVNWLVEQGLRPGVISRGYRGNARGCAEVFADSNPAQVGDEPLLIHFKTQVPVVVGRDRLAAARTLLQRHPEVNILVSDDGLQHYRLQRQLEIAVVDASTGLGNGLPLPAGPLREPVSRLKTVDALVRANRNEPSPRSLPPPFYQAAFTLGKAYALCAPLRKTDANDLPTGPWLAITGIGHPQGFFSMLGKLGWSFKTQIFPDHHQFVPSDIPDDVPVVMTEKDAVKCSAFARSDWWALELEVQPEPAFIEYLLTRLKTRSSDAPNQHGSRSSFKEAR